MTEERERIKSYFHKRAFDFDSLYGEMNWLRKGFNKVFRKALYLRSILAFGELNPLMGKSILDVGCGSGRFSVESAKGGAGKVVGIDLSPEMIAMAKELAKKEGVEKICQFIQADFMDFSFQERFDYSIALGFFDYVKEASLQLQKMTSLTKDKIVASFPGISLWRTPLRKLRYALRGCPVYFYTKGELKRLLGPSTSYKIIKMGSAGYLIVMECSKK